MAAKIAQYFLTIWIVLTLNFALPRVIPGNPLAELDDPQGLPIPLSEGQRLQLMAYYGLDEPILHQYRDYLLGLMRLDLGWSISYNAPVSLVLMGRLRWTLPLLGFATIIYILFGIVLGNLVIWYKKSFIDKILLVLTSTLGSFPSFFLSMLLIVLFGVKLRLLPLGGAQSPMLLDASQVQRALDYVEHAILPISALVLTNVGEVYYLTRNAMLQTLGETYIIVARAKGLGERRICLRHALPNALLPIVSLVALRFGFLVMGAVMVETTFAYPGIGSAIVEASRSRDYPLLQGAFALVMLSIMGANLVADFLHGRLDPRIRQSS